MARDIPAVGISFGLLGVAFIFYSFCKNEAFLKEREEELKIQLGASRLRISSKE